MLFHFQRSVEISQLHWKIRLVLCTRLSFHHVLNYAHPRVGWGRRLAITTQSPWGPANPKMAAFTRPAHAEGAGAFDQWFEKQLERFWGEGFGEGVLRVVLKLPDELFVFPLQLLPANTP